MTMMAIDDTYYNDDKGDNLDAEARYDAALGPFLPLSPASEYSRQSTYKSKRCFLTPQRQRLFPFSHKKL